jgi:hypothetical protein
MQRHGPADDPSSPAPLAPWASSSGRCTTKASHLCLLAMAVCRPCAGTAAASSVPPSPFLTPVLGEPPCPFLLLPLVLGVCSKSRRISASQSWDVDLFLCRLCIGWMDTNLLFCKWHGIDWIMLTTWYYCHIPRLPNFSVSTTTLCCTSILLLICFSIFTLYLQLGTLRRMYIIYWQMLTNIIRRVTVWVEGTKHEVSSLAKCTTPNTGVSYPSVFCTNSLLILTWSL